MTESKACSNARFAIRSGNIKALRYCLENELNAEFGEGNWREATEEEVAVVRESGEGGFFFAKADGEEEWINLPIYWVDYTEEDE